MSEISEDTLNEFSKRLQMFQTGFEMITKNLEKQLAKFTVETEKLAENTSFMPKIMKSNKEFKKSGEKLEMLVDTLMVRLDKISRENNL